MQKERAAGLHQPPFCFGRVVGYADRAFDRHLNPYAVTMHARVKRADGEAVHPVRAKL
jgi:hypothetical protein